VFEDRLSHEGREKHAAASRGNLPGEDLGRIISLSDGVFAFALTLLVLGLTVPAINATGISSTEASGQLGAALHNDWPKFVGYLFAFLMIALWWTVHHRTFRYIERYDFVLMWLNMAVLLEIAVMPFVLQVFTMNPTLQDAVILFAALQVVTGLTLNLLWRYAAGGHRLIDPKLAPAEIRYFSTRGLIPVLFFAISIGASFVSVGAAQIVWAAAAVTPRLFERYGVA
jgi:TMEM175 potassium channel family protein